MKRILTFLLLIGCVSLMGFRGAGWRAEHTVAGEYTFSDSTTVDDNLVVTGAMDADSTNTDHLVVNDNAVFEDTVNTKNARITANRYVHRPRKAFVTFTFDDGFTTDYTKMRGLFKAKGVVACVSIITDTVGTGSHMTWAQIDSLHADGWEVLNHSKTHEALTTKTEAQVITEMTVSQDTLETHGYTVNTFVYGGGSHNKHTRRLASNYFRAALGYAGTNTRILETYNLARRNADTPGDSTTLKGYIDTAESDSLWLIFVMHQADVNDSLVIAKLIDYAQGKSIPILTINQVLDSLENPIDLDDALSVSMDGGIATDYLQLRDDDDAVYQEFRSSSGEHSGIKFIEAGVLKYAMLYYADGDSLVIYNVGTSKSVLTIKSDGNITVRDSTLYLDAAGADSNWVYNDGTYLSFRGDNPIAIYQTLKLPNANSVIYLSDVIIGESSNKILMKSTNGISYQMWTTDWAEMALLAKAASYFGKYGNDTLVHFDSIQFRSVIDATQIIKWNADSVNISKPVQIGGGGAVSKIVKVGSHLAIILGTDTLWAAADTTNF